MASEGWPRARHRSSMRRAVLASSTAVASALAIAARRRTDSIPLSLHPCENPFSVTVAGPLTCRPARSRMDYDNTLTRAISCHRASIYLARTNCS
jgi:hypothetical protein